MTPTELREIRSALGWTQAQLAEALYVSQQAVQQWEAGDVRISERRARQIRDVVERETERSGTNVRP